METKILTFDLVKKFGKTNSKGTELRTLKGEIAPNGGSGYVRAVLRGDNYDTVKAIIENYRAETGYKVNYKGVGKSLEITAASAASTEEKTEKRENAISIIMELLGKVYLVSDDQTEFIRFYNGNIGIPEESENNGETQPEQENRAERDNQSAQENLPEQEQRSEQENRAEQEISQIDDEPAGAEETSPDSETEPAEIRFTSENIDMNHEFVTLRVLAQCPKTMKPDEVYEGIVPLINEYDMGLIKHANIEIEE